MADRWQPRERHWLTAVAVAVGVACLIPPVTAFARRYVFVESVQFAMFAVAVPGLLVLGAPWRLLRLSRGAPAGTAKPADRLAMARGHHPSFVRSMAFLALFAGLSVIWRLPAVIDALARNQALAVLEMASLVIAGIGVWLEITPSPPLAPRGLGLHRAVVAALAMWFIWIVAYILGFATHAVFRAYQHTGSGLSPVTDQALATWSLWLVAGLCFAPVVFTAAIGWLRDTENPDAELGRVANEASLPAVKGWGHQRRGKTGLSRYS
jgi:cytochrome c oxidase assembly factor CtaG